MNNINTNTKFSSRCYNLVSKVPIGKITTYGEIARILNTKGYRAVGNAMANNPNLFTIPCHRVIKSDGSIGQYSKGENSKIKLLIKEGIPITNGKIKDLSKYIFTF